jgi:hypothetical protein
MGVCVAVEVCGGPALCCGGRGLGTSACMWWVVEGEKRGGGVGALPGEREMGRGFVYASLGRGEASLFARPLGARQSSLHLLCDAYPPPLFPTETAWRGEHHQDVHTYSDG